MLYYKEFRKEGAPEWVVFVHGAGGSSAIWYKQLRSYKEKFNVLLIDLRGHGRSQEEQDKPRFLGRPYSFEDICNDILEVLQHRKVDSAHFVGISLGTILIRQLADMAPQVVRSMVLGGAITRLTIRSRFFVFLGNVLKRVVPFMWLYRFFAWIIMPRSRHKESRNLFIREARRLCRREFLRWFRLTREINPLLRYFKEKELPIPVLYIMGEEDYMFLEPVKEIVKQHKNALLSVIARCGHVVNVERPDDFNLISLSFLQNQNRTSLLLAENYR